LSRSLHRRLLSLSLNRYFCLMCTEESKQYDKPDHLHKFTMIPLWRVCEESWKLQWWIRRSKDTFSGATVIQYQRMSECDKQNGATEGIAVWRSPYNNRKCLIVSQRAPRNGLHNYCMTAIADRQHSRASSLCHRFTWNCHRVKMFCHAVAPVNTVRMFLIACFQGRHTSLVSACLGLLFAMVPINSTSAAEVITHYVQLM